ncbi:MAG: phosphoribosylanthranilate isomerase [Methylotetracoccus sp.]|jgi:phosphoribosylanthranilate isomerase|nr:phosphoribosylanthranilate isomerase [Methylotetracoccus sp.]
MTYPWQRTRVKICGLTRPADAESAALLGADALGLVFYPPSPRSVSAGQAATVVAALPPFVTVVGLFVDEDPDKVQDVLSRVRIDLIQFHGDEDPEYCRRFGKPYIKAIRVRDSTNLAQESRRYAEAQALLLDAYHPSAQGGTGQAFEWSRAVLPTGMRMILAGGLTPDNVRAGLALVRPYAVDVSSGVEAEKGVKDSAKMAAFLKEVYQFDHAERQRHPL